MAFRQQQQRPQAQRQPPPQYTEAAAPPPAAQQKKRPLEESQDWVLFAPPSQVDTSQTPRTAELSRASYFGSLDTGVRSELVGSDDHILRQVTADNDDDGTELDSLDDGLQAFDEPPSLQLDQSGTVLPTHDGLGGFPTSYSPGTREVTQEQMWQHERYNPQRKFLHRRLSSVQRRLDALDQSSDHQEIDPAEDRRLRVERWRTEQSKAVLEEIERETRRRYRRMQRTGSSASRSAAMSHIADSISTALESNGSSNSDSKPESEGFWQRITRTVIRDLMGLDENTLSVIFGEDPPTSCTPTPHSPFSESLSASDPAEQTWEDRLLSRIARELGVLVYQLSELEGAFDTYNARRPPTRMAPIPETAPRQSQGPRGAAPSFRPTLADASLWGIDESHPGGGAPDAAHWERHPSILMIFKYLRARLLRPSEPEQDQQRPPSPPTGPLPASWASSSRADMIRRHHPLVSRATAQERSARLAAALGARQGSDSCASQSTKRSRRSEGTGQSRKFWELGGSVAGESGVSSGAGVGWGGV